MWLILMQQEMEVAPLQVSLSVSLVQQLQNLAQRSRSSLFVTVLAAFKVLLSRYSNREDLVVGTPSLGRSRPDLQGNLVGCFVNLTMLRTSLAGKLLSLCCVDWLVSWKMVNAL